LGEIRKAHEPLVAASGSCERIQDGEGGLAAAGATHVTATASRAGVTGNRIIMTRGGGHITARGKHKGGNRERKENQRAAGHIGNTPASCVSRFLGGKLLRKE